jgi:transposase
MATERLSMRNVREILRLKWVVKLSHRQIARSVGLSSAAVAKTVSRANAGKLTWEQVAALDEEVLEQRLYGPKLPSTAERPLPDWAYIHAERRRVGVTLELLHFEYLQQHPDGYRYTAFCDHYREWLKKRRLTMRQEHRAGEKTFVDDSGKKPCYFDASTGGRVEAELFVAVLGASNFTFAEATASQSGPNFIASHVRAFAYFEGVTSAIVPDQLRSGVTQPCRYEPGIQRTYEELAAYNGTAVVPARPAHPRDKAKVEAGVLVAQRWILARLRNQTFFSLDELNARIAELLEELNDRPMRVYKASRRELYERLDRPALKPLPVEPFVYGEWKRARVNIDYHIEVDGHYYSTPHALVHEQVEARVTVSTVEIFHRGQRVASHRRSAARGGHTTVAEHMPKAHQKHLEWTPSRITHWAQSIGPNTEKLVEAILRERAHPEQGYRSCLGILRLSKRYGSERLEAACERALSVGARSYRHVESILKHGLDRVPVEKPADQAQSPIDHENVRGRDYYN